MDLLKNDVLREIDIVQKKTEEIMKEFLGDLHTAASRKYMTWTPSVDIYETEGEIIILAELAGVRREDVSVILDHNTICITGRRVVLDTKPRIRQHQMEIAFGPFKRIFRISVPIRCEEVEACFQDGFLTVRLPKQTPISVKINISD